MAPVASPASVEMGSPLKSRICSPGIQAKQKLSPGNCPRPEREQSPPFLFPSSSDKDGLQAPKRCCVWISPLAADGRTLMTSVPRKTGSILFIRSPVPSQVLPGTEPINVNELEVAFQRFFGSQRSGLEVPTLGWMDGSALKSNQEASPCLLTFVVQPSARSEDFSLISMVSSSPAVSLHKLQLPQFPRRSSARRFQKARQRLGWDP
ncbi:uncharacterized protein LOC119925278 [Tachyglossus aculeatus]|uniref:uncharacterized protein LOC119925278 n=1 Tax=Tachyglossus aculeatus TaxID=9261 RepID=UPI0018F53D00|nr:uncharacterized protein LOC119925278 [Tachyglossus aculeatus]